MGQIVYAMCAVLSVASAIALFRGYRITRSHLLLWSSLCFAGLAVNNVVLYIDLVMLPSVDFQGALIRNWASAISGSLLLFGLIWELT